MPATAEVTTSAEFSESATPPTSLLWVVLTASWVLFVRPHL